jgi:TonB family protein
MPLRFEPATPQQGFTLSGPSRDKLPSFTPSEQAKNGPARPSLRDQIASLGTGLQGDVGKLADQTISLNDPEPRYNDYLTYLKGRIQAVWFNAIRLRESENPRTAGVGGEVHLVFVLNPTGSLEYIALSGRSGFPILDNEALGAIKGAAPFAAFPPEMGKKPFNIVASFYYHSYPRRP